MGPPGYPLPCILAAGKDEGKTILITAQIHSGEYAGTPAVIRCAKEIDPQKAKGNILFFPCVNVTGFFQNSNAYVPEDHGNLNGNYPGNADSVSGRIAQFFVQEIFPHIDFVMDLHSGGNAEALTSCLFYPENTEEESLSIAKVLTIPYLIPSKSVRGESGYAGNVAGIPSLLLERGYANYCKEEWISEYQKDIFLCLHALGIYSYEEMEHKEKVILRKMIYQTAEEDGLWFPEITEGARVRKGDLLGRTEDFYGNLLQEYKAVEDGIVMYYTCGLRAAKGHSLVAYGLSESMEEV